MRNYLEYESWTFTQNEIKDGNLYRSRDLLCASLEVDTLNVTVECADRSIVNFRRNAKLVRYFGGKQDGIYYVQSIKRVGPKLYTISATSKVGLLQTGKHMGGIYNGQTVKDVVLDVCGAVPVMVKSNIKDIKLYGWLPIAEPRANLSQVLFAVGATVKEDQDGTLRVEGLWDGLSSMVPADRMYNDATVEYGSEVSKVSVTEHQYVEGGELTSLFEGTAESGDVITFSGPHYDLQATGFTILEQGANYAKLSAGTGTLQGRPYIHNTREITRTVNAQVEENIKSVTDATLVSLVNSNAVAERLASYYRCTETISAPTIYDGEQAGDRISVYHPFDFGFSAACLQSEDITLSGVLRAQGKSLVGFVPTVIEKTVLYEYSEIISENREWTVPDGVKTIRAVLIGGGTGGGVGENGKNGAKGQSAYAAAKGGEGEGEPGTGGEGGKSGVPGAGGKIYSVDIPIDPDVTSLQVLIGTGGHGSETEDFGTPGESTKINYAGIQYNSESGASSDAGFPDIGSGITFGSKGKYGIPGGAGGDGGIYTEKGNAGIKAGNSLGGAGGAPGIDYGGSVATRYTYDINTLNGANPIQAEGTVISGYAFYSFDAETGEFTLTNYRQTTLNSRLNPQASVFTSNGAGSIIRNIYSVNAKGARETYTSRVTATADAYGERTGGGGGGGGASGAAGGNANASTGGDGADAVKPAQEVIFGMGGTGGNGGGGGGGGGGTYAWTHEKYTKSYTRQATESGIGGKGSPGGDGAPGCVLLYYGIPKVIKSGQLQDRTGRRILDRHGRRIIM